MLVNFIEQEAQDCDFEGSMEDFYKDMSSSSLNPLERDLPTTSYSAYQVSQPRGMLAEGERGMLAEGETGALAEGERAILTEGREECWLRGDRSAG